MKRYFVLVFAAVFLSFGACGDGGEDPYGPWGPGGPGGPGTSLPKETNLPELDGIPSSFNMDRWLFYVSTHEDGPGLHAYHPSTEEIKLIDSEYDYTNVAFLHTLPLGEILPNGSVKKYRAGGVMYARQVMQDLNGHPFPRHQYRYVSSDPTTGPTSTAISSTLSSPGSGLTGLFSFDLNALTGSSFLQTTGDNLRFDVGMDEHTPAMEAPEGAVLISTIGGDLHTHAYWLYVDKNDALVFYDRDFQTALPVIDAETNAPITGVSQQSQVINWANYDQLLVGIVFKPTDQENTDDSQNGIGYMITAPSTDHPTPTAQRVVNDQGNALQFAPTLFGGIARPSDSLMYGRDGVIVFASGNDLFSMLDQAGTGQDDASTNGVNLTRIDGNKWSRLNIQGEDLGIDIGGWDFSGIMTLSNMLIPVSGHGTFWAPNGVPELIEVNGADPSQWKRTALSDKLPEPESTPTTESANGWVYYNHDTSGGGAIAYHVPSKEIIHLPRAQWVGASSNGDGGSVGAVSRIGLSEIFVRTKDNQLGAVAADAPNQGIVILGALPSTVEEVNFAGIGAGSHRLVGLKHKNDSYEVIAVDTSRKGSLKHLLNSPAVDWEGFEREVFGEVMTRTIQAGYTRPADLY